MSTENAAAPAPPVIDDATVVSRNACIVATEADGAVMMMHIDHGRYFTLDDVGSDVWRRIEAPCSFAALVAGLAVDYDADHTTIATDVARLLGRMTAQEIVQLC
jgi:pyridoxal biosynthesis lyase PdxS